MAASSGKPSGGGALWVARPPAMAPLGGWWERPVGRCRWWGATGEGRWGGGGKEEEEEEEREVRAGCGWGAVAPMSPSLLDPVGR